MDTNLKRGILVFFFGMLGLILAGIEGLMYINGTVINEFVTGSVTIEGVQIVTIVAALLFGCVFAVYTQG
jgi:hypothetical protein